LPKTEAKRPSFMRKADKAKGSEPCKSDPEHNLYVHRCEPTMSESSTTNDSNS